MTAIFEATLGEVAAQLRGELIGDPSIRIDRIGPLESATASTLSFLANPRYEAQLATTAAACVLVSPKMREAAVARGAALVLDDPYLGFAKLTQWWALQIRPRPVPGVHPTAVIDPTAVVASTATIGPFVVIEARAALGDRVVIGAHSFIGAGSTVGADTRFAARVTFNAGCHMGARGIVHSGVVIGGDGFGFAPTQGRYEKIEQLGGVSIGDDVEIGANTCIDRGALDNTVIEQGVKLDNLIQLGHNVRLGANVAIAGCVGIAGSTTISAGCTVGGAAMIQGHITLAEGVHISAATAVTRSIHKPGLYTGFFPCDEHTNWEKNAVTLRNLHALRDRIRSLEKKTA